MTDVTSDVLDAADDLFGDAEEVSHREIRPEEAFLPIANISKLWCSTITADTDAKIRRTLVDHPRRVAADLLRIFLAVKVPVILWGPVGARKTRSIEALSAEHDANGVPYKVISIQPSTIDSSILHGMYYVVDDSETGEAVMKRSLPEIAEDIQQYHDETGGYVIVFLDEMTTCMPSQQHALLGFVTHGHFGPIDINNISTIAMAANPPNTVTAVNDLGEQFLNRCSHIPWFGERQLFVEDWSSGFNNPDRAPDALTQWYTIGLMEEKPEAVFRNDRWSTDDLVPYDMLEHTERIVTEHARVVKFINETFTGSVSTVVRHHYLVEMTRAMMGNEWAKRMGAVCSKEHRRIDPDYYIKMVRDLGISETTTAHELKQMADDKFLCNSEGTLLDSSQIVSIGSSISERVVSSSTFLKDETLALWAIGASIPDGDQMGTLLTSSLASVMFSNIPYVRSGSAAAKTLCPDFVGDDLRNRVGGVVKLSQAQK